PVSIHHVHHAVVDRRLRQFASVVAEARAPDRHESLDVRFIDLAQRAILVEMIAHPEGGDIFAVLAVVDQLLRGLSQRAAAPGKQYRAKYLLHRFPPVGFRSSATLSNKLRHILIKIAEKSEAVAHVGTPPVPTANPNPLTPIANRLILAPDERSLR